MSNLSASQQIIIRHISGSKKGETASFRLIEDIKIKVGRGPNNQVSYDAVTEDVVSRNHCVIQRSTGNPDTYEIIDSQSRNGTFVNEQRVTGKTVISSGDIVRLGEHGPSFEFDLNPRPIQKTRIHETASLPFTETKLQPVTSVLTSQKDSQKESIGKQTMLHMLSESEKKSKKGLLITIIAIFMLVGTGTWIFFSRPTPQPKIIQINNGSQVANLVTPEQIAKINDKKVVHIYTGWKLVYSKTGDELFHYYMPNPNISGKYIAVYVEIDKKIEPCLVDKSFKEHGKLERVGGEVGGSGFVVDERGFIITNRHVAAPWLTNYHFPAEAFPGILFEFNQKGQFVKQRMVNETEVENWVPKEALSLNKQVLISDNIITGESSFMDVRFAHNALRTPAKIVRISNVHDAAMIKIDLPESLTKVTLFDNNELAAGMPVTVLGYPAMSLQQYVKPKSLDALNTNSNIELVPVPTLSTGFIGRLAKADPGQTKDTYFSAGDYYQLTINSTGPGNSGGPVYDDQGKVIGIFSASGGNGKISLAVPIKYAIDLMETKEVVK